MLRLTDIQARSKVCEIIAALRERGGFEQWWQGEGTAEDERLQEEIIREMMEVIQSEE